MTRGAAVRDHCNLRVSLGAYVLDGVDAREREVLDAHLRDCSPCRMEVATLTPVARLLGRADPALVEALLPHPDDPTWTVPEPRHEGQPAARDVPRSR
ncbi:zf-HC2 domain-containing protein [Actinophytocola sp. NPDC049390]|uniref:zf-HC2 domain-containing protein n=1 Tax=Actinophytocola sp. NPDC049390 TaxID=3363894 RepID=UPI00378ACF0C